MKCIIRVENEFGVGPFFGGPWPGKICFTMDHYKMDPPANDPLLGTIFNKNYRCGYKNIDEMKHWAGEHLDKLVTHNHKIYIVWANDAYYGTDQVIFDPSTVYFKIDITDGFILPKKLGKWNSIIKFIHKLKQIKLW